MSKLTIPEIKKQLDEKGIEYKSNMKQEELLDLLNGEQEKETSKPDAAAEEKNTETKEEPKPKQYVVVRDFKDLEDNSFVYFKGDSFPRKENKDVDEARIQELKSTKNKQNKVLIKEQE
ncbi:HeH/LEM domain-containing protein [Oceanobacillus jordanicus]|uniref:HeH/LEM domain-containing protein n=1 Tax=Oceanobacillus jordanicus TaxID=2867266 RepID=A0AAW5B3K8_9BACI|nr:HeH/LEM domain-containing protein [Oceanobacillus jordanicus]MCG3418966.1 hypothetical protein [Oceanobacillus jordanicus]